MRETYGSRAPEHRHSCGGTKKFSKGSFACSLQRGDRTEDAEGKYLLRDIHWSVAHKAKLRKPLFGRYFDTPATYTSGSQLCRGKVQQGGRTPPKGLSHHKRRLLINT